MHTLLNNFFALHHGCTIPVPAAVRNQNAAAQFTLQDGRYRAHFTNPLLKTIFDINYEQFVNGLPQNVQQGMKRCDFIVYASDDSHFLLAELTFRPPSELFGKHQMNKRDYARIQLEKSLGNLIDVPQIIPFISRFPADNRCCCFFSKEPLPSSVQNSPIQATITAFNRVSNLPQASSGLQLRIPAINALGFNYREFSGNQQYSFS
jgi:hypothetical protein